MQHEERDGRTKKCYGGQKQREFGWDDLKDGLTISNEVLNRSFPPKFCLPQLESYDGSKDPLDHIESKMLILLQMTLDEVIYRAILTTLKGAARVWFSKIPPGTIADFKQLSNGFFRHFIRGQRHKKPIGHLLNIQ